MRSVLTTIWPFLQPSNLLFLIFALGALLLLMKRRRAGKRVLLTATLLTLAILILPIQSFMMVPLETRFPQPALPDRVDGIIMLGGSLHAVNTAHWGRPQLSERGERIFETAMLAKRYPTARIVVSGGAWRLAPASEAELATELLVELGVPRWRITQEQKARNTQQNAEFSMQLVNPKPDDVWVLVTSASHMPRSVGVFEKLGWPVIAYPVDYETNGKVSWLLASSVGDRLSALDFAAKAWGALVAYRVLGATDTLFPGPKPQTTEDSASGR